MAFAGLQELPRSGVWLEETKADVMVRLRKYAWHSPVFPFSSLFLPVSRAAGRSQMMLQVIFKNLWLSHSPDTFSVTNPGCKITDAKLTAKLKSV